MSVRKSWLIGILHRSTLVQFFNYSLAFIWILWESLGLFKKLLSAFFNINWNSFYSLWDFQRFFAILSAFLSLNPIPFNIHRDSCTFSGTIITYRCVDYDSFKILSRFFGIFFLRTTWLLLLHISREILKCFLPCPRCSEIEMSKEILWNALRFFGMLWDSLDSYSAFTRGAVDPWNRRLVHLLLQQ